MYTKIKVTSFYEKSTFMSNLTDKNQIFLEEYFSNGFNETKAYQKAFPESTKESSKISAAKLLKHEKILAEIEVIEGDYGRIARAKGVGRKDIVNKLADIINGTRQVLMKKKDPETKKIVQALVEIDQCPKDVISAINTLAKLVGDFTPEEHDINFNDGKTPDFSKMSKEAKEEYKKKLLAEL